jgi:UDP-xylose/UDP-N-acetylglucosamine transporter B4
MVAVFTLPQHLSLDRGWRNLYLKERSIPLRKWTVYTAYFLAINILNNMAFSYKISIPLHIILRSAGPVTTMAIGRIWGGKRYPTQKVIAVYLLFSGVVVAAISDAMSKQKPTTATTASAEGQLSPLHQTPGFALLFSALLLSALMGLYTDEMYSIHGRSGSVTLETMFYSHAMSLPFFITQAQALSQEFMTITTAKSPNIAFLTKDSTLSSYLPPLGPMSTSVISSIPLPVILLFLNALTQMLCILGVNRLSAQSSSLTVSIILNVRKLVSLLLSIWLFGNKLPLGVMAGAAIVFIGGGLYAVPVGSGNRPKIIEEKKKS